MNISPVVLVQSFDLLRSPADDLSAAVPPHAGKANGTVKRLQFLAHRRFKYTYRAMKRSVMLFP